MISAVLDGGVARARRFLERCQIFTLAESLGGVESLIEHPALMTHATIPADNARPWASTMAWSDCPLASNTSMI